MIGAGQAGLTAAHYLQARGVAPHGEFIVLDANVGPGGAWRQRWDSLTFQSAHDIHPLPRFPLGEVDPSEPSSSVVSRYYGAFEEARNLPVVRPVKVLAVRDEGDHFHLETDRGPFRSRVVINATGTWNNPFIPHYPKVETFRGTHFHTKNFRDANQFAGQRVLVVGGGTSAIQHIQELAQGGVETVWSTRGVPRWTGVPFDEEWGAAVEDRVAKRTSAGLRTLSVVAETGIPLSPRYAPDVKSGLLISRGPILNFTETGVVLANGGPDGACIFPQGEAENLIDTATREKIPALPGGPVESGGDAWEVPLDAVLWATGFRPSISHLAPLKLREKTGGIRIAKDGVSVTRSPRLLFTGYGASASTLGATRAGRQAAAEAVRITSR